MIRITADEKRAILKEYPQTPITRTMKQRSKRHSYYMCEELYAVDLLESLRKAVVVSLPKTT